MEVLMHRSLRYAAISLGIVVVIALSLSAQSANQKTGDQKKALYDAHKGDFDYLLGDWQFTGTNRQYGKTQGYWSAARLGEGAQIIDEYRIAGDDGETYYVHLYCALLQRFSGPLGACGNRYWKWLAERGYRSSRRRRGAY